MLEVCGAAGFPSLALILDTLPAVSSHGGTIQTTSNRGLISRCGVHVRLLYGCHHKLPRSSTCHNLVRSHRQPLQTAVRSLVTQLSWKQQRRIRIAEPVTVPVVLSLLWHLYTSDSSVVEFQCHCAKRWASPCWERPSCGLVQSDLGNR